MQAIRTGLSHSSRFYTKGATALVSILALCFSGIAARAQAPTSAFQYVVLSQETELGAISSGGGQSGQEPAGTSIAVDANGDVIVGNTYGGEVLLFSGKAGGMNPLPPATVLGSPGNNVDGVAVDSHNNLFVAFPGLPTVVKVPYINGSYLTVTAPTSSTPNCTGNDTVECVMSNLNTMGSGVGSMVFDSKGDLFYATANSSQNTGGSAPNSIWECTAACLYTGTPAATLLYTEPNSATPTTTGQLNVGGLAVDAYGDLFFTDSAVNSGANNQESFVSHLNELVYTSGTGFATSPTVIYTHTPSSPGNYDDEIDGVAVDASGTVYALIQNTGGILAFPNNKGVVSTTPYLASTVTGKLMTTDGLGNLYVDAYISGDAIVRVGIDNLTATPTATGAPSTATFTTVLNDGGCTPTAPMVTFTVGGASASEFSAATTGSCAGTLTGASFPSTLTFNPTTVGTATATITATDTIGNSETATASGNGNGTVAAPAFSPVAGTYTGAQQITITDATVGASIYYTTDGTTPGAGTGTSMLYSAPITVSASETLNAIGVDSGDTSSGVATATYIINLAPPTATPVFSVAAGTYTTPQQVAIADSMAGAAIYYTTDGSTPTTSSNLYDGPIVVSSTETINAIALATGYSNSAVASALYTLNVPTSAFQYVVLSQETELGAISSGGGQSGQEPAGTSIAVDANGDVIVGNTYGGEVLLFSGKAGGMNPLPPATVLGSPGNNVDGVAVDSHNNLFVAFPGLPTVVKVPYINGSYLTVTAPTSSTPNCTGNDTVECVMSNLNTMGSGVGSMVFDSKGDLFYATANSSQNTGGSAPNSIWECTAACLYTGTPAATLLYTEPNSATPTTTGQLNVGGLAVDAYGDLFFTDSAVNSGANNQESFVSHLNELVYTSGTGFATSPTVIYTHTPSSPGNYDDEIDGVAVDASGTVYALIQNTGGILAFPNNKGVVSTTPYLASTVTGKLMTTDGLGNLYVDAYISGDAIVRVGIDNLTATPTATGAPSTATFTTVLNDGGCTPTAPMVTFTVGGASASEFSAATTGSCAGTLTGASFPSTLTFNPTTVGTATATITATDTNNSGTAAVTGNGTGMVAPPAFSVTAGAYSAPQTVSITDATAGASIYYTTDGSTPAAGMGTSMLYTGPITVSVSETLSAIAVDSGDTSSAVATAAYSITLPGAAATPTFSLPTGTYITPQAVSITDTTPGAAIYYTVDGTTPTTSSTLYTGPIKVSSTETINAIAVASGASASGVASALYTINVPPSAFQNIVLSQETELGALPNGSGQSGQEPAGANMAVDANGDVIMGNTYGSDVLLFSGQAGGMSPLPAPTVLGSPGGNPDGMAVDSHNNLFVGFATVTSIVKIPYVNGAYVTVVAPSSSTPNCTGNDTVECVMSNLNTKGSGVGSLVFDSKGDLFYSTTNIGDDGAGTAPNSIWECTAACLYTGTPAATLLYTEPTSATPTTTGQLNVGGLAVDAYGDLFFTDSAVNSGANNQESFVSNLNELVYTSGTGFATTPTVIYTHTPSSPGDYDDEIDGVAVDASGTVYALIQNTEGILAFPNNKGAVSTTPYLASTVTGKLMTTDGLGNLYVDAYISGDAIVRVGIDNITVPTSPEQNAVTATNLTTILNDGGCTATPPTVSFAFAGTSASAFSAATTGTCNSAVNGSTGGGASFATTLTFTPTSVGTNSATITATDSLKNTGTAEVIGVGTPAPPAATPTFSVAAGTYTTVQMVTIADTTTGATIYYTTDGSTPAAGSGTSMLYSGPISVSTSETLNAIATATGFAPSAIESAAYVINLPTAATPTFSVAAGTYTVPQTVTLSDTTAGATIYYTLDGSAPTANSTAYSGPITVGATETINAIAVATNYNNSAVGSALYTINLAATATPTFSVAAGTYATVQSVTVSDATTGAKIYYTTDGSMPVVGNMNTLMYSGAILVPVSTTINAIAVDPPVYNNSAVATAAYVINLPAPALTLAVPDTTLTISPGGTASVTLTITGNAAFNGPIGFSCSGFLPIGDTCSFSPVSVTVAALGNATTKLTVTSAATTASLRKESSPLFAGTMLAFAVSFLGFRKRRRLQMLLLAVASVIGLSMFTGCATTSTARTTSSQFVVTASGVSCPVNMPNCSKPTPATGSIPLILTVQ